MIQFETLLAVPLTYKKYLSVPKHGKITIAKGEEKRILQNYYYKNGEFYYQLLPKKCTDETVSGRKKSIVIDDQDKKIVRIKFEKIFFSFIENSYLNIQIKK